jgi:sarcosine dehydrogenase
MAVGPAGVRAVRLTYVGELGWELHVPTEQMAVVYDVLWNAGTDLGLANAGHYAINSLRLEKGYRAWGSDISPDDTPWEAGLAFAVCWDKSFLGRDALLQQKSQGLTRRLTAFVLADPGPPLWGSEPIYRDGLMVGYTSSGTYGHTLGGGTALGYVNHADGVSPAFIESGHFEINVSGTRYPAKTYLRAPYDPERKRILA